MPSGLHEVVIELLREAPARVFDLLRSAGVEFDDVDPCRAVVIDPTVPQLVAPALVSDLVIELAPAGGGATVAIVIEVQRAVDRDKELTWPVTWATARQRVAGGVTCLLVITDHDGVAAWAQRVLSAVVPVAGRWVVLGPATMPRITDAEVAARIPEVAALSLLIHAGREDEDLAASVAATCSTLSELNGRLVYDVLLSRLTKPAVAALEALMQKQGYEWQSDFARKHRAEGEAKGRAEGEAKGRAELRDALDVVLSLRGIALTDEQREIVVACTDFVQLRRWIHLAATVRTTAALFEP